jgi:hypothetical protein
MIFFIVSTSQGLPQTGSKDNSTELKPQVKDKIQLNAAAEADAIRLTTQANQFKLRLQQIHYENDKLAKEAEKLRQEAAQLTNHRIQTEVNNRKVQLQDNKDALQLKTAMNKRQPLINELQKLGSEAKVKNDGQAYPLTATSDDWQLHIDQYQLHQRQYQQHIQELQTSAKEYDLHLQQFRNHFQQYHHTPLPELPNSIDIPCMVNYPTPCGHWGSTMIDTHRDLVTTAQNSKRDLEHLKTAEQSLTEQENLLQRAENERSALEQQILNGQL